MRRASSTEDTEVHRVGLRLEGDKAFKPQRTLRGAKVAKKYSAVVLHARSFAALESTRGLQDDVVKTVT
jgi:hypothetical protein